MKVNTRVIISVVVFVLLLNLIKAGEYLVDGAKIQRGIYRKQFYMTVKNVLIYSCPIDHVLG
jgi:hypothetical protein